MRIRTKNDLKDILDKDLAWRKVELTSILTNVNSTQSNALKVALRTSILLLYAHWEGFVKKASETYLSFVANQSLKLSDLDDSFLAIALKQQLHNFTDRNDSNIQTQFVSFFRNNLNEDAQIEESSVISAKSNLNSKVLKQILISIGIDYSPFELKANLLDEQLLKYRNTIAHGEFLLLDKGEYITIHSEVFAMINEIKNRIENAVFLESYKN